jgi:hypothetical protein
MIRAGVAALAASVVIAWPVHAGQRATREQHVLVAVTGNGDQPVPNLSARDFIVREDEVAREVIAASPAPPPTHIALLIDDSAAAEGLLNELHAGIRAFVHRALTFSPEPAIEIMTFGERPTKQTDFTTSASVLQKAGDRLFPRSGAGAYLLDALQDTTEQLRHMSAERPLIVAFVIDAGPEMSAALHDQVADDLKAAHASLWTVELQNGEAPLSPEARERALVIGDVARTSGGINATILGKQGLDEAFGRILQAIGGRYDVRYARPDSLIPPTRLTVDVRDRALHVVAPQWIAP